MSERQRLRHTLNSQEVCGPTHKNEDGTYDSFHLKDAEFLGALIVTTRRGDRRADIQLINNNANKHGSAVEDWVIVQSDDEGNPNGCHAVELDLRKNGFRHLGVVLRAGLELGVYDQEDETSNIFESLGTIEEIQYIKAR